MLRRILVLLAVIGCALAAAPTANAQAPTIVTDITFPEEGAPFGTFTASAPLCPSGTFVDEFVGGGGNEHGTVFTGSSTIRKHFTCANGSGTFTILFHAQSTPATPPGCVNAGPFAVVGGTGAYAHLRGTGDFCNFPEGERVTETFTGRFLLS